MVDTVVEVSAGSTFPDEGSCVIRSFVDCSGLAFHAAEFFLEGAARLLHLDNLHWNKEQCAMIGVTMKFTY